MSPKLLIDTLGWTGSVLYLLAYALVSLRKTEGDLAFISRDKHHCGHIAGDLYAFVGSFRDDRT